MSSSGPRYPTLLFGAGLVASVGLASQLFSVIRENDTSSPLGRLSLLPVVLPYFPVLVATVVLLLAGSWNSAGRNLRWGVTLVLGIVALTGLALLPILIQDAGSHAFGVMPGQLTRYRLQVIRFLLYLGGGSLLLLWALWKYRRSPAVAG